MFCSLVFVWFLVGFVAMVFDIFASKLRVVVVHVTAADV
jgi:hypothetical protein